MSNLSEADVKAIDVMVRGHIVATLGDPQSVLKNLSELKEMKETMGAMVTGLNKEFAAVKDKHRQHEEALDDMRASAAQEIAKLTSEAASEFAVHRDSIQQLATETAGQARGCLRRGGQAGDQMARCAVLHGTDHNVL